MLGVSQGIMKDIYFTVFNKAGDFNEAPEHGLSQAVIKITSSGSPDVHSHLPFGSSDFQQMIKAASFSFSQR